MVVTRLALAGRDTIIIFLCISFAALELLLHLAGETRWRQIHQFLKRLRIPMLHLDDRRHVAKRHLFKLLGPVRQPNWQLLCVRNSRNKRNGALPTFCVFVWALVALVLTMQKKACFEQCRLRWPLTWQKKKRRRERRGGERFALFYVFPHVFLFVTKHNHLFERHARLREPGKVPDSLTDTRRKLEHGKTRGTQK